MTQALLVSNAVLWMVVVLLGCVVAALARQIGVLHERVAPAGALMVGKGPAVGEPAPVVRALDLSGTVRDVGGPGAQGRSTLLFFLSPTCPVCQALLPVLRSIPRRARPGGGGRPPAPPAPRRRWVLAPPGRRGGGGGAAPPPAGGARGSGRPPAGARRCGAARRRGRPEELQLLAALRDRRLPLRLLWRLAEHLPAGDGDVAPHLDRHLPQPRRREGLHHLVQRLLWAVALHALPVHAHRGGAAPLPHHEEQRPAVVLRHPEPGGELLGGRRPRCGDPVIGAAALPSRSWRSCRGPRPPRARAGPRSTTPSPARGATAPTVPGHRERRPLTDVDGVRRGLVRAIERAK